jgi:hypothetical protein
MSIPVQCPHCGYSGGVAAALAGRRVRCPECDEPFLVAPLELAASDPTPGLSFAFLDEDGDVSLDREQPAAPLVPRSVQTPPPIPLTLRAAPAPMGNAPGSSARIYVGVGIGIAGALSLSIAFVLLFR